MDNTIIRGHAASIDRWINPPIARTTPRIASLFVRSTAQCSILIDFLASVTRSFVLFKDILGMMTVVVAHSVADMLDPVI